MINCEEILKVEINKKIVDIPKGYYAIREKGKNNNIVKQYIDQKMDENKKTVEKKYIKCVRRNHYGFVNEKGKTVIPFVYEKASSFSEELAPVQKKEKWGFLNNKGKIVIPFVYEEAHSFSEGLACVKKDGKWGFINKENEVVIRFVYDYAYSFSEGLACVKKDGKYGFIDKENKEVIPFIYESGGNFKKGFIQITKSRKQITINQKNEIFKYKSFNIELSQEELIKATIEKLEEKFANGVIYNPETNSAVLITKLIEGIRITKDGITIEDFDTKIGEIQFIKEKK